MAEHPYLGATADGIIDHSVIIVAIKNVTLSHFITWTPLDMAIIHVKFDPVFWTDKLLPSLQEFYANFICPHFLQQG